MMKKCILLLTSVYIVIMSSSYSIEGAVAGGVRGLMPILEPIAKETVIASIKHINGILAGNSCWIGCTKISSPYCLASKGRSFCKGTCQKIQIIGGYTLRIRFGINDDNSEKWSLGACVRRGIDPTDKTTVEGKKIEDSIAVYSQQDLEQLLHIIALKMAAQTIVDTGGANLTSEQLRATKKSKAEVVEEARGVVSTITNSLTTTEENIKNIVKKYGPQ